MVDPIFNKLYSSLTPVEKARIDRMLMQQIDQFTPEDRRALLELSALSEDSKEYQSLAASGRELRRRLIIGKIVINDYPMEQAPPTHVQTEKREVSDNNYGLMAPPPPPKSVSYAPHSTYPSHSTPAYSSPAYNTPYGQNSSSQEPNQSDLKLPPILPRSDYQW